MKESYLQASKCYGGSWNTIHLPPKHYRENKDETFTRSNMLALAWMLVAAAPLVITNAQSPARKRTVIATRCLNHVGQNQPFAPQRGPNGGTIQAG